MGHDDLEREMADIKKAGRAARPAAKKAYIAEHKVAAGDSMSAIAQQYYGSGVKEKWMAIYEANKDVMGDNPTLIHPGQVLKIPELDE
ncbi:MAG: LysM peptidoglycan-binding domain-containing protein [Chloroflexota bacterium]|jgi:nucleoid-associated protein YgaU